MANQSWLRVLNSTRRNARPQHAESSQQVTDIEDAWYDTSSSEGGPSPVKKSLSADDIGIVQANFLKEELAKYLPYMPPLFSEDLPPCGPPVQVAYSNVNHSLRQTWLSSRGRQSVADVCRAVKDNLSNQSTLWPVFDSKLCHHRKPWRRELVFYYELRWIDYFVREAHTPEPMTESELIDRDKDSAIPEELHLKCDRDDVLQLWNAWHEKKRAKSPSVSGIDMESCLNDSAETIVEEEAE